MKRLISAIFALCILTGIVNAQKSNSSAPIFIIQVTDPQFGMYESDKGFSKETELYEKAVEAINKLNPDFVVLTGDLINKKDDRKQITEFKRITGKIKSDIPVYYSPGNHDIGQPTTQQDIDNFISDYGHDRFSFKHKKSLFIGINTCLIKSNTPVLEEAQLDWLRKELSKGKRTKNIVLFTHYPFFINLFDEADAYFNIANETRNRYLSLFKEYGVDAVFAGHLHNNGSAKYGDMQMVTTSAVGKPLGKVQSGIRVIKVYPNHVESVYYTLNEIPEKI
jgi:3',5'-cyclic AMP phosphodiesterase CpdA